MNGADISSQDFVSLFIFKRFFYLFLPADFLGYLAQGDGRGYIDIYVGFNSVQ
jgi:hypothetical protein